MTKIVFMRHPANKLENALNNLGYRDMMHYASFIMRKKAILDIGLTVLSYIGDKNNGTWATLAEVYKITGVRQAILSDFPEEEHEGRRDVEKYNTYTYENVPRHTISWVENFNRREWDAAIRWIQINEIPEADFADIHKRFDIAVQEAQKGPIESINQQLKTAPRRPELFLTTISVFRRNPNVVALTLKRSEGICEAPNCRKPAPFIRKTDSTPYLEVHHKIPLAEGGDDTVDNAIALCPNCHREAHFGNLKLSN